MTLLRSGANPSGWDLAKLLRKLRLEVEQRAIGIAMTGDPDADRRFAEQLQLVAALMQAEALSTLYAMHGQVIEARPAPRRPPSGRAPQLDLVT